MAIYLPFRERDRFFNQGGRVREFHALNNKWMDGWSYRKWLTVSRASGAVTNYQMKLLVGESSGATGENVDCGGKCLSTFNDLRFTKADGTTLLDYWIESISGTTPNQLATVWIEFDSIGTDATTFYMYYGNANATSVSSGANTFLDGDDFTGADNDPWNAGKWDSVTHGTLKAGSAADIQSNAGRLYQASNTNGQWSGLERMGKNFLSLASDGLSIMAKVNVQTINGPHHGFGFAKSVNDLWSGPYVRFQTSNSMASISDQTTIFANATNRSGTHIYELQVKQWQARLLEDNIEIVTFTSFSNLVTDSVKLACAAWSSTSTFQTGTFDYIFVRQYLATEPAWGTWGTEEAL